jgi:hypothetical protein
MVLTVYPASAPSLTIILLVLQLFNHSLLLYISGILGVVACIWSILVCSLPASFSNHLLGNPVGLRAALKDQGYLLIRQLHDRGEVLGARCVPTLKTDFLAWISILGLKFCLFVPSCTRGLSRCMAAWHIPTRNSPLH